MKAGWNIVTLGDLCKIARGGSPRPIQRFLTDDPNGVNWIKIGDASRSGKYIYETREKITPDGVSRSRLVKEGDFLLSNSMSFGRPYIMRTSGCIHDGWLVLTPDENRVDQDFLYHLLGSSAVFRQFDDLAAGSTVRNLNIGLVESVKIPLPPLEVQKQIVAILDETIKELDRARENVEANLKDARGLFGSAISRVFDDSQGWPTFPVGEIGKVFDGPHATPKTVDEGPLFLGISSLVDGRIELTKTRHVTDEDFATWTRRVTPRAGDVVFAYETRLGQVGLIPEGMKCCLGRRMGLVRLDMARVIPEYFVLCYLSPGFQGFLANKTVKGATVDRISIKDFPNFPFPVPSMQKQSKIVSQVHEIRAMHDRLMQSVVAKSADLDALRQSLLQKAFSGELT